MTELSPTAQVSDPKTILNDAASGRGSCFCGVYDGHGGADASEYTVEGLHKRVLSQMEEDAKAAKGADGSSLKVALVEGFAVRDLTTWTILQKMALITSDCGATRYLRTKWPQSPRVVRPSGDRVRVPGAGGGQEEQRRQAAAADLLHFRISLRLSMWNLSLSPPQF